ncbi:hypothetical protein EMIT07CA2_550110 [Brevibacillus sp. IT-7CA2]
MKYALNQTVSPIESSINLILIRNKVYTLFSIKAHFTYFSHEMGFLFCKLKNMEVIS